MKLIQATGLITKEVKYGDNSRIITIISPELGKISAITNKYKGGKGKALPSLQLFSYSSFVLFKGSDKGLYRINESDIIEPFKNLREDLMGIVYASYFCDVANRIVMENEENPEFLRLILNMFYALSQKDADFDKIKTVFEWKTAVLEGYAPDLEKCSSCGAEEVFHLDLGKGVGLCKNCGKDYAGVAEINADIKNAIKYIENAELSKVLSFEISDKLCEYLNSLSEIYLRMHLGTELKTLEYLKKMK